MFLDRMSTPLYAPPRSMRTLLVMLLAFLVLAAPAQARKPPMTFHLATRIADSYWAKRGVLVPCDPKPVVLTYAQTATWGGYEIQALADLPTCTIIVTPWADGLRFHADSAWAYCQTIVHEVGHIAGLEHSDDEDSIMAPDPWVVPWGCSHPRKFLRGQWRALHPKFRVRSR